MCIGITGKITLALIMLCCCFDRLEDNLVLGSVGFDTRDGFKTSTTHETKDEQKTRASEKRAKFLQFELSQEGPRSCSPPPSPPLPAPGSGSYVTLFGNGEDSEEEKATRIDTGIKNRVRLLEQNLKTPNSRAKASSQHGKNSGARQAAAETAIL